MDNKKQTKDMEKFQKRLYAFITIAILTGILLSLASAFSVIFRSAADLEEEESKKEKKAYEVQHAELPVTFKELGFEGTGEESSESTEASGSKAAMIYQYSDIFYQEDGSYTDYCKYGVYICDNGKWADRFVEQKEDTQELSEDLCDIWGADSGVRVTEGDEAGRLYLRYGDHLLYWQSNVDLNENQIDLFLRSMETYMEKRTEL